jgi:hypothetical protein
MLFKSQSYTLLLSNFRWFTLTAQPTRASDASQLVSWHFEMCHLSRSRKNDPSQHIPQEEVPYEIEPVAPEGQEP